MKTLKKHLMEKSHVIWDYNGTLLDDTDMVVQVMTNLLKEYDLPAIDRNDYLEVFCFPVKEYYRRLGFDYAKHPFEVLSEKFIQGYLAGVPQCRLHTGMKELIHELKEANIRQSVLSAAHEVPLREQLKHFGIHDYFDHIYGLSDHHATGKVARGLELMSETGISREHTILVGDTDHDWEVAKEMGIEVVLLGDGHQAAHRLEKVHSRVIRDRYDRT